MNFSMRDAFGVWSRRMIELIWLLNIAAIIGGLEPANAAEALDGRTFSETCAALVKNNSIIASATIEAALFGSGTSCVVRGKFVSSATSTVNFRIDLPEPTGWNGKLLMIGGAGFDGIVPTDAPNHRGFWFTKVLGSDAETMAGYIIGSSDSGHQGRGRNPIEDFSWVSQNPTALANHGYQANHIVLGVATDLSVQVYAKSPKRRYIVGGSNGGRAGLVAIQHYPQDYDGAVALEPAISQEGFAANLVPQMLQHIFASPDNWLDKKHIELYEKHELNACDGLDGLKDGILGNVKGCDYDGNDLLCKNGGHDSDDCLTSGQLESIRLVHVDKNVNVTLADGWVGYAGFGRGGESSDWLTYLFGPSFAARAASDYALAENIVKWGITNDPNASVMTHDPTKWAKQYRVLSDQIDATDPKLLPFYQHGGKLIVWYGASDACVSYMQTARYLESVARELGNERTKAFLRFYISPATGHSMAGAGASTVPLLSALENWVEKDQVPPSLTATLTKESADPGGTRPLCEYPLFPRYRGKGDAHSASSFDCAH
jgi:feruloyl esterase